MATKDDISIMLEGVPRNMIARRTGLSTSYICSVLSGYHRPSEKTRRKLLDLAMELKDAGKLPEPVDDNIPADLAEQLCESLRGLPDENVVKIRQALFLLRSGHSEVLDSFENTRDILAMHREENTRETV